MAHEELNQKLLEAAESGDIARVKEAISLGANVNTVNIGYPYGIVLIHAAYCGYTEIVQLLLEYGADVNAVDKYGTTALMTACWNGYIDITRLLLEHGADVNTADENGDTALIYTAVNAVNRHTEIAKLLIEHSADVNAVDNIGETALMRACLYGNVKLIEILMQTGADINIINSTGQTALDILQRQYPEKYKKWIETSARKKQLEKEDSLSNTEQTIDWNI